MSSRAARVHFDPHVDIDWDAPWQFEMFALPPTSVSLYGTRRWRKLTPEQQRTLALHEAVSGWSPLAYLSAILTSNELRRAAEEGLNSAASRSALLEVARGSRATITFGRLVRATGLEPYKPPRGTETAAKLLAFLPLGSASYASTLLVEETFIRGIESVVEDPDIEPHVRQAVKIYRFESEERLSYARSEVAAAQSRSGRIERACNRVLLALLANVILRLNLSPAVYRSVGFSPVRGLIASRRVRRNRRIDTAAPVVEFLDSVNLLDGMITSSLWTLTGVASERKSS